MADAGTITLNLDANSVKLVRELMKAEKQTKRTAGRMRKDMTRAFKTIAKSAALFGVALIAAGKQSITFADNIGKSADALGLGIEQFQEYEFAAKRAGIQTSQFISNMTAFVKRIGEAQVGMGPLVSGLKNLNPVLLENLKNTTSQGEALRLVADAIQNTQSATERAAIANSAFSRAGIQMVVMLRDGAKGLDDMSQTARDLGAVLKEDLVRQAELAADKMGDLQRVLQIRVATVVTENADAIIAFAQAMITFMATAPGFLKFMRDEFNAFFGVIDNADFIRLSDKLAQLQKDLKKMEDPGLRGIIGRILTPNDEEQIAAINEEIRNTINLLDEIEYKILDAAKLKDKLKVPLEKTPEPDLFIGPPREFADIRRNKAQLEYLQLIKLTRTAQELHTAQITRIGELFTARLIPSAEDYADLINRINDDFIEMPDNVAETVEQFEEMNEFAVQAAHNIQNAFADFLFDPFDDGLRGMVKGFANAIRRMIANAAALSALKSIFGGMSSGGFFGKLFGSLAGRDSGGRGYPGNAYVINPKAGPEVFIPDSAGTFIPNSQLGGDTFITNIDARGSDDPGKLLALVPVISAQIEQNIMLKQRRGM